APAGRDREPGSGRWRQAGAPAARGDARVRARVLEARGAAGRGPAREGGEPARHLEEELVGEAARVRVHRGRAQPGEAGGGSRSGPVGPTLLVSESPRGSAASRAASPPPRAARPAAP